MNKRDLFDRVVKDFYTRFKGEAVLIREAISSGDKASAERMAHTIKGLAGSIGAKELQAAAARLEDAIYSGHSDIEALRTAFESALETVLKGLQLAYALD